MSELSLLNDETPPSSDSGNPVSVVLPLSLE